MSETRYGVVVVGAGVVGLAAAWHLLRLGCRPLALVEQFRLGHTRGSSHGGVRMTRSTYANAEYAALMQHVHAEEWPRLERDAGATLVRWGDVLFFGPDRRSLAGYAAAVRAAGVDVERLTVADARRAFPSLRFADDAEILRDRTGGVIAAGETLRALHRLVVRGGGEVREETRVLEIDRGADPIRVVSDRGMLLAERVVIASGPWLRELVPAVRSEVTVVPQVVEYFRLGVPASSIPGWVHFGGEDSGVTYALAEVDRDALKAGLHVTRGADAHPDAVEPPPPGATDPLRVVLERVLATPILESLGVERCLYTTTPTEEFVIDHWPGDSRVAFASACSGHGFKFAPLTGRILAELVIHGRADLPSGRHSASLFALRPPTPTR